MSDAVGELYVEVKADTTAMKNSIQKDATSAGSAAGKSAGSKLGKSLAIGAAAGAAAIGAGAIAATAAIVNLGREYEDNLLQVQAVTGATEEQMKLASQAAKDLGNDITLPGVSAAGAADAMLQLAKAGFSVEEASKAADGAMRLSVAANMEVGAAAEITANAVGAFNLKAEEAGKVSDLLARGSTSAATTVAELGTGMAQSSAMFAAAGVPIEDMVTQLALMANAGVKGSDAGTSLKTMLQRLQAPSKEAAATMKKLGVNVFDAQGNMLPMRDIVDQWSSATADLTEEQKAQATSTVFGADAARAANIVLAGGVAAYDELAGAMNTAEGAAADLAAATSKGLSGAIEAIQSTLETIAIDIYEQIAPSLTEVLKTIQPLLDTLAPVLGELGKAFAVIATVVGEALTGAVADLVPAVVPLIQYIGEIAQRLGPLLSKILAKVADVLTRVLAAVMPLLEPLMDLAFNILDALWPIVELVIDVLLILVDALAPVLEAVGSLLGPLGVLINELFKAIMPILEPLMPVIEMLAAVLGDILVRAIGLLIGQIGLMIQAWSKVAPFILRNVIKPILERFLAFAAALVGAAASAFGWVPGLGDKLEGAKDAINKFSKDATKGIEDFADTVETEGSRIGKELTESATEMMLNPDAKAKARAGGKQLAKSAADGVVDGVYVSSSSLYGAGMKLGNTVEAGARDALQTNSPSKVFIKIGGDVVDGFELGLKNLDKIPEKFRGPLEKAIQVSNDRLSKLVSDTRAQLDDAIQVWEDYRSGVLGAVTGNVNFADALTQTREQEAAVLAAREKLNEALMKASQKDASQSDQDTAATARAELAKAEAAVRSYEGNLNSMLDQSELFGTMFSKASDAMIGQFGADSPIWNMMRQQMLAAGPVEGAALAQYLVENGLSPDMQQRLLGWDAWAGQVAKDQADKNHAQGVTMAKDAMLGIEDKVKAEEKRIKKIGKAIGDGVVVGFTSKQGAFKRAVDGYINAAYQRLGINSPSKVFRYAGEMVGEGFTQGVNKTMPEFMNGGAAFTRTYAPSMSSSTQIGSPDVRVFIGDRELTDIVRTEVGSSNDDLARSLVLGRR